MKILFYSFLGVLLLSLICTSCSQQYYYAPDDALLMGLSNKGDIRASGAWGGGSNGTADDKKSHYNIQAGYSPVQNMGIQASYFNLKERHLERPGLSTSGNDGFLTSFAIGGYTNKKYKVEGYDSRFRYFDFYGGAGFGKLNNIYERGGTASLLFRQFFLQVGAHYWIKNRDAFSFGLGYTAIDYRKVTLLGNVSGQARNEITFITEADPIQFVSPNCRIQVGFPQGRFFVSTKWLIPINAGNLRFLQATYHLGLVLDINEFVKSN